MAYIECILYNYIKLKILKTKNKDVNRTTHHVKGAGHPPLNVLITRIETLGRISFTALLCSHGNAIT